MSRKTEAPRLGRGLAALIVPTAAASDHARAGVVQVRLDAIRPSPYQPRGSIDEASLHDLAQSIRAHGLLQPVLLRLDATNQAGFELVAGERRWRAARLAGLEEIPALVRSLADAEVMAAALVENLQREDLNSIEEAEGYRRLIDEFAMTQEALGTSLGKSRSHVANTLRLLNLPPSIQRDVRAGKLSAGHARAILAHPEPELAARTILAQGLSVRQAEALAAGAAQRPPNPERERASAQEGRPPRNPDTVALEEELTRRLGLRIAIRHDGQAGSLQVHFRTLDQLDGLIRLLSGE